MQRAIKIKDEIKKVFPKKQAGVLVELVDIVDETVKVSDFNELKAIVADLAKTQRELAEAQKRTEQRVEELAEAQKRTEQRVEELAEAQRETQKEVSRLDRALQELAEAQKRTEQRVEELADAQKRTEEELRKLIKEHERTREMVAGLSDTVGYGLEDKIMPYIPDFAKKEFGIEALLIDRRNIVYPDGRYDEVNVYVEGRKNGEKVYIIGECKAKPGKKEIDRFAGVLKRIKDYLNAPVYSFIVGYHYSPEVEQYLKEKYPEIKIMKSFEFEMKYARQN